MKKCPFLPISVALALPGCLFALPEIQEIAAGQADITRTESALTIITSDKAILNYERFNIGPREKVEFIQPNPSSTVLNRVVGTDPSSILGSLSSNGRVFLVNPSGVFFGPGASVNVGSLVVSTLDISDVDFLNDKLDFTLSKGAETSSIINQGLLAASNEGSILLLAPQIRNEGSLVARAGRIALVSGEKVSVDFTGDGLMSFMAEGKIEEALIEHLGTLQAPMGHVALKMSAANRVIQEVLNIEGVVEGSEIVRENGIIRIVPESEIIAGQIEVKAPHLEVSGRLDASDHYQGHKGGEIQLLGDTVSLKGASIDASGDYGGGTVLVGGDYQGKGDIPHSLKVFMDDRSSIRASSRLQGDGGKVILWADERLNFGGKIFAEGGILGGNGGLVETSSEKGSGQLLGYVNTSASKGQYGQWLIDPLTITVSNAGAATLAAVADCSDTVSNLTINASTINAATSDVVLCATTASPGTAITVNSVGTILMSTPVGITFRAVNGGIIALGANITTQGGSLTFFGPVQLTNGVSISTSGGNVAFTSTINGGQNLTIVAGSGSVGIGGNIGATNPLVNLSIVGNGGISLLGNLGNSGTSAIGANTLSATSAIGLGLGSNYYKTSGAITVSGQTILRATSTTVNITSTTNVITLNGTLDATAIAPAASLNISASTACTLAGDIGSRFPLSGLTVTAPSQIQIRNVGNQTSGVTGGMTLTSGNIQLRGAVYNISGGTQTYAGPAALNIGTNFRSAFGSSGFDIFFSNTLSGGFPVNISAGAGNVTFTGDVAIGPTVIQSAGNIQALSTNGISCTSFAQSIMTGSNTYSNLTTTSLFTGNLTINASSLQFNNLITQGSPISISAPITIGTSGAMIDTTNNGGQTQGGHVFLSGGINGTMGNPQDLTVKTGTLGVFSTSDAIGATNPIGNLSITADGTASNGGIYLTDIGADPSTSGAADVVVASSAGVELHNGFYQANSFDIKGEIVLAADTSIISTGGAVTLNGTVDGVFDLDLSASMGTVSIVGLVGGHAGISNLTIDANAIFLAGVGGIYHDGVSGTIELNSNTNINFGGTSYSAGTHIYTVPMASNFIMQAGAATSFISRSGSITFNNGDIFLGSGADLFITTANGNFSFPSLSGSNLQSLFINLGSGTANLGSIGSNIFDVTVSAGEIIYNGSIEAVAFNHFSNTTITNAVPSPTIDGTSYQVFNALGGNVGSLMNPIDVNVPDSIVIAGATTIAAFTGTTSDGTIHCLPSNPPPQLYFNNQLLSCNATPTPSGGGGGSVIPLLSARHFFVPGIYDPFDNLGSDFYFRWCLIDDEYMHPKESYMGTVKKKWYQFFLR